MQQFKPVYTQNVTAIQWMGHNLEEIQAAFPNIQFVRDSGNPSLLLVGIWYHATPL